MNISLDHSQLLAVNNALSGHNRIITGGAGTGKTTIIKAVADGLNGRCILMAPTGKAAARLREATGYDAGTIHRELGWDGVAFRRSAKLGLPVIVDEASMVGSWLLAKLIEFEPSKLILVGDSAQLPPVEKGQPFHDLVKLRPEIVSTLSTCHRAKGAVHIAAQAIRDGKCPEKRLESGGETFGMYQTGGPEPTMQALKEWIGKGIIDPEQDIIIAPQYGSVEDQETSDGGIHAINRMVKDILNPSDNPDEKFTIGDRIIINKNFGPDDLWNGDLGTVMDVDVSGNPYVYLDRDKQQADALEADEEWRLLSKTHARETSLAYTLSVHKSQGSQFRRVIFVVFRRHKIMLSRSLIYTAITRAREGCVVMGELQAFYSGLNETSPRQTVMQYLAERSVA